MNTPDYPKLSIRNGFAVMAEPVLTEQLALLPGKSVSRSRCDRAGRIQLMREAYAALLRKEPAPVA